MDVEHQDVQVMVKHNKHRRYHKASKGVDNKPRKDWHFKLFKNPAENLAAVAEGAQKKSKMQIGKLLVLGILGGIYIGFGGALAVSSAGGLDPSWSIPNPSIAKLLAGFTFPVALVLIVIAGGELFTSNIMFMTVGALVGNVKWYRAAAVLLCSFFTNYLGTVICAAISIHWAEFLTTQPYTGYITRLTTGKMNYGFGVILLKAIPANMLVNLAIICATAAEDITGKILAIYLPISLFAVVGFEHVIANEFYFHLSFFNTPQIMYGTYLWKQLIASTLGNIIGGMVMGICYWYCYLDSTMPEKVKWIVNWDCCSPKDDEENGDEETHNGTSLKNSKH